MIEPLDFSGLADLRTQRTALAQCYHQLPAPDQEILQLISVIYDACSRTAILKCLDHLGIKTPENKPYKTATLRPILETLEETGLLLNESNKLRCHPLVIEVVTRDAVAAGKFAAMSQAVEKNIPLKQVGNDKVQIFESHLQFIRTFRIGLYSHNFPAIAAACETYYHYRFSYDLIPVEEVLELVCNNPFDPHSFQTLPPDLTDISLVNWMLADTLELSPAEDKFDLLLEFCSENPTDYLAVVSVEQLILRNRIAEATDLLTEFSPTFHHEALSIQGWLSVIEGDYSSAISYYRKALAALRKQIHKKKVHLESISGLFYGVALLKEGSLTSLEEAIQYFQLIEESADHWLEEIYTLLKKVAQIQKGDLTHRDRVINTLVLPYQSGHSLETLFGALCVHWVDASSDKESLLEVLVPFCQQASNAGYTWIAAESAALIARVAPSQAIPASIADLTQSKFPLADIIIAQSAWQLGLQALGQLNPHTSFDGITGPSTRLAWFVSIKSNKVYLEPKEQKRNTKGIWTKGRKVSLNRLCYQPKDFDYLTAQDLKACAQLETQQNPYYGYRKPEFVFNPKTIAQLIGHPAVFWQETPHNQIDIVTGEPELLIKHDDQGQLSIELSPKLPAHQEILVLTESPTRLKVITINPSHRRMAEILGQRNCLKVPVTAQDQVLSTISTLSGLVTIQSDIGGGTTTADIVPTQSIPHIHLLPAGDGLKVALLTRPFGNVGPYFLPGSGGKTVIAEVEGKRLQTDRNLEEEYQAASAVVSACPTLNQYEEIDGEWIVSEPEDCLELLSNIDALDDDVILEWPEGEKLRISHHADLSHLHLKINQKQDWFEVSGELALDEGLVLDMQSLLALVDQAPGRFVQLGEGQFLALTQSFRKHLDELRTFTDPHGKDLRFHPLASLALENILDDVGDLQADQHWQSQRKRLRKMERLDPDVPSTLQVELRDYQVEGFRWLAKLSHWGVGACLADDMGLGKTLQAIAVILTRAPKGPTLVIAPTSVGMNWLRETQQYAPTLTPLQFDSRNRQELLDDLQPYDLLVCSYGLLQQPEVAEMLAQVQWQTIVLDEAQAIKNFATKRSQAAMKLQGELKLITTGTPIENHLGELWNLFRFINPGLLGSLEWFNQRFAIPIERHQDKDARQRLKKLIQPFMLRRTKSQVLQELPSRTEILLQVELSTEEQAFYEALRRKALMNLSDSDAQAGQKHLQVLAELMKLRRACCNARLVMPESALPSAKLQLFGQVLGELMDNHHKALVFSQFVDHLHLLRDYLDKQQIRYQYLDGSTPAKQRRKRVDAFQAGEGDVFLISLKAGGTGLNLTAADYVIHMDPWWNPAVEDQASDRAHRIGQQRPVTIYRLVSKGTIEEKIVELHHQKRDLADSLLEGADMSGKVSTEQLLQLMQTT